MPDRQGWGVAVLDGHESHASYRRHCSGCLQRTIHTATGDRVQYYHRQVTLMLLPGTPPGRPAVRLLLDQEPQVQVPTARVVGFGHQRWDIENHGFNELVNDWHADHVFRHDPTAIECFLLVAFLAYNLFHAFLALNLKPAARHGKPQQFWANLIIAELYREVTPRGLSP